MSIDELPEGAGPAARQRDLGDDPLAMRALAHPVRMRLLEELTLRGPMTATEASRYVEESPSSLSFHLRTLAKYGFVEEAPGGVGRQRPWQVVAIGNRWSAGPSAPAASRAAGATLAAQVRQRDAELLDAHLAEEDGLPEEWAEASVHANFGGWLTAAELAEIGQAVYALWVPYLERLRDPTDRPPGSRLVHMTVHGFPRAGQTDTSPTGTRSTDTPPTDTPTEDPDA